MIDYENARKYSKTMTEVKRAINEADTWKHGEPTGVIS